MMRTEIRIVDTNEALIEVFKREVGDNIQGLSFKVGDALDEEAGALVSPGNSWGIMDGGFDGAVSFRWPHIQADVQAQIDRLPFGELLVGRSLTVPTTDPRLPHLIYTPTMRAPGPVIDVTDLMLAVRSAVALAMAHNCRAIVMPGMGTGVGRVSPEQAAPAMIAGIQMARHPMGRPATWQEASHRHFGMNG